MKLHFLLRIAAIAGFAVLATISIAQAGNLRAGAAKVDISPTPDMFPFSSSQKYGSLHDPLFARAFMVTMLPNGVGYIAADKAYLLPAEKTVGNRLKPGCVEPAIISGFQQMMKSYLPVWQAAK